MSKPKRFGFHVPGMTYSELVVRESEWEVRASIRWRCNVKRCPAGTEVWEVSSINEPQREY